MLVPSGGPGPHGDRHPARRRRHPHLRYDSSPGNRLFHDRRRTLSRRMDCIPPAQSGMIIIYRTPACLGHRGAIIIHKTPARSGHGRVVILHKTPACVLHDGMSTIPKIPAYPGHRGAVFIYKIPACPGHGGTVITYKTPACPGHDVIIRKTPTLLDMTV